MLSIRPSRTHYKTHAHTLHLAVAAFTKRSSPSTARIRVANLHIYDFLETQTARCVVGVVKKYYPNDETKRRRSFSAPSAAVVVIAMKSSCFKYSTRGGPHATLSRPFS